MEEHLPDEARHLVPVRTRPTTAVFRIHQEDPIEQTPDGLVLADPDHTIPSVAVSHLETITGV
jgi:hypothetical protein